MIISFNLRHRIRRLRALPLFLLAVIFASCDSADRLVDNSAANPEVPSDITPDRTADQLLEDSLAVEDSLAFASGDPTGGLPMDEGDVIGLDDEEQTDVEILGQSVTAEPVPGGVSFANAYRGGIPFGTYHLPKDKYGEYSGSLGNISPNALLSYLETARRKGTRVMLSLSGSDKTYKTKSGFSLSMWKARVARFKGLNLSSYINDGTIIGHYLLDEPQNRARWHGGVVSRATIDEMAKYSKQLWPGMTTIVRGWPEYLKGYKYRYLDGAWAQYSARYGASSQRLPIDQFMSKNVSEAKAAGLGLVIGMNLLAGGGTQGLTGYYPGQRAPSANELKTWGSVMLSNSYPCAFLAWKYDTRYLGRSDIKSAISYLAGKARSKPAKSCRPGGSVNNGGGGGGGGGDDDDDDDDNGGRDDGAGSNDGRSSIALKVSGRTQKSLHFMTLTWSGAKGSNMDVFRNGSRVIRTPNDGRYVNSQKVRRGIKYSYKICQAGTSTCSNVATVSFK